MSEWKRYIWVPVAVWNRSVKPRSTPPVIKVIEMSFFHVVMAAGFMRYLLRITIDVLHNSSLEGVNGAKPLGKPPAGALCESETAI
jgi:hypothetical protein